MIGITKDEQNTTSANDGVEMQSNFQKILTAITNGLINMPTNGHLLLNLERLIGAWNYNTNKQE